MSITWQARSENQEAPCESEGRKSQRPFGEPVEFSGILEENEVEVVDPATCSKIIKLFDLANKQVIAGEPYQETVEKIREIRHKSRQELEEKYAVVAEVQ